MEIPVSNSDLNEVVHNVARDLIEERAINGSIDEVTEQSVNEILDEVIFVIERYMYYINSIMDNEKTMQAKKIFETQRDFE